MNYPITTAAGYRFFQKSKAFKLAKVITVRWSNCTLMAFRPSLMGWERMIFFLARGIAVMVNG